MISSAEPAVVLKKLQLTILDENISYHGSQSRINNTSAIKSNSKYLDMKSGYLSDPICLTLTGKIAAAAAANGLDYSVDLAHGVVVIILTLSALSLSWTCLLI